MSRDTSPPGFEEFARWLASKVSEARPGSSVNESSPRVNIAPARYERLLDAARAARDQMLQLSAMQKARPGPGRAPAHLEVLQLLAAAEKSESAGPPELVTARGFRVTLAYEEGAAGETPSVCVLVRCPSELIEAVQGETAFLWNGTERFELGEFDSEGKAIGTLPAGIEISLSDLAQGRVKLEEPPSTDA